MGAFEERDGDLFTAPCDESSWNVIAHGVNTLGVMGAGIAVGFKQRWPEMFSTYRALCDSGRLTPGRCFPYMPIDEGMDGGWEEVWNIASQDRPGPHARLDWLLSGLLYGRSGFPTGGLTVVNMPRIGCGIGGLKWSDVRPALIGFAMASPGLTIRVWS